MDDRTLRRREFLARTAAAAGLAGLGSLPAGTLLAEAARAQITGLPSPRNLPLDHVVVVMMENRSFDHYFGWLDGADGSQDETYTDPSGEPVGTRHASSLEAQWQGCGHPDPGHGWEAGRAQLQGGFLADGSGNDEFALTYYDEGEIEFLHAAAGAYTIYDRFFCSLLGPTWPNRYYKWSAQSGGRKDNTPPLETAGNQWETIFDRAVGRGVTARYYHSDLPFSAVWGARGVTWTRPLDRVLRRLRARARCRTSRSSTRRSATAAAATASRPTSTRTATSGSARRGWPTSCAPSSSRPATGAARCSSSTTSGAASSTTCARRACATPARAAT